MRIDHVNFCIERDEERMALQNTRPNFWSLIVEAGTHRDISKQQLYAVMGFVLLFRRANDFELIYFVLGISCL